MDEMKDSCYTFEAVEIDFDFEFDASRYFDFTRMECLSEVREAESWFESAGSYPPSPYSYMAKLIIPEDILLKNVNTLPKYKDVELADAVVSNSDIGMDPELPAQAENIRGRTYYDHMAQDIPKAKTRSLVEAPSSRGSTLMKPTASQLAKQNQPRFHKPLMRRSERTLENPCGNESQAAKRQKLEGGNLRKDGHIYNNSERPRLKTTIPREPELETAQRAQRMRPKNNEAVGEHISSTVRTFKAGPLNRKILKAPSLRPRQKTIPRLPQFKVKRTTCKKRCMCPHTGMQGKDEFHFHDRCCTDRVWTCFHCCIPCKHSACLCNLSRHRGCKVCILHCPYHEDWACTCTISRHCAFPCTHMQCDHSAPEMFNQKPWNDTGEVKLEDVNVSANPPSSATKGSEEGSPRASLSDNGSPNAAFSDAGNETSSFEPEQTRRKNVPIAGSSLNQLLHGVTLLNFGKGGKTFIQCGGSRNCRQYQAGDVRGGTVNQGDVRSVGNVGANMENDEINPTN